MRYRVSRLLLVLLLGAAAAQAAEPSPIECSSSYSKGQEDRLAGRLFAARASFMVCESEGCPRAVATDCSRWRGEVEQDLPTIRLNVTDVRGTPIEAPRVFADGQSIAAAELRAPIILEAGPHSLRVEADGFNPIELERALRPTDRELEVAVTLQRVGETKPVTRARVSSPSHTVPVAAAVLAGTGVAALGASLFFGLHSHSQYEDLKTSCAPRCEPSRADSLRSNALISDVTLLGAVAALGAAVWFYFDAPRQPANTAMGVSSTPHGADLRLHVAF